MVERVILVNQNDEEIGTIEKLKAHEQGLLHRAISVFVFNDKNELLLQQRASSKYHSANLWSNTCCSHPRPGESNIDAAKRRLNEEMGIEINLENRFSFIYKADFENGLTEHEFDHVFFGKFNGEPKVNELEVSAWRWASIGDLNLAMKNSPHNFTVWFKILFEKIY